jgi:hypothetical protein
MSSIIDIALRSSLARKLAAARQAWQSRRRWAAQRRAFEALDACALRDLAVCRGEFDSLRAEAEGRSEHTRRRVMRSSAVKERT